MKNNLFRLAALIFCLMLFVSVGFADEGKKTPPSKASAVKEKPTESAKKEQAKPKPDIITPAQVSPKKDQPAAVIKPVAPQQTEVLSASSVKDRGRQIKWQIVCSGGNCGASYPAYWFDEPNGFFLCGTAGQLAVGSGSSESFGMNSGFWQEFGEAVICGDANSDGIVNIGDVVYLIGYLFRGGPAPIPYECVGDVNNDDIVNIGDVVYLIGFLFRGGSPPDPDCCSPSWVGAD